MSDHLLFRVPFEHRPPDLGELLARAWPESNRQRREEALTAGQVQVDQRPVHALDVEPGADARVLVQVSPEHGEYGMPETAALARGGEWVVVDKPAGMPGTPRSDDPMDPTAFLADSLGLDRSTFTPVWPMPTTAGGPWLFGLTSRAAEELRERWAGSDLMTTWVAITPRPAIAQGTLYTPDDHRIQYSATAMRNGLCEMQLTPEWSGEIPPDQVDIAAVVLEALAEEGTPVVGDRRRGGYLSPGGLRLRLAALFDSETDLQHSWQPPDDWWPADPVVPPGAEPEPDEDLPESIADLNLPTFPITAETLDRLVVKSAHPWIRRNEVAGRPSIEPGTLVRLQGTNDVYGPIALTDGRPDVAARVWSRDPLDAVYRDEAVEIRLDEALARRTAYFREAADLDLFRLVHGEADGLPGLIVDRVGPVLRAVLDGACAFPFKERVYDLLVGFDDQAMILELERPLEPTSEASLTAREARAGARYIGRDRDVIVREHGVRFLCNPWQTSLPVAPVHRPTRRRLLEAAEPGDRWLVLASPDSASPVTLATRGIERVWFPADPDTSTALDESIVLNGYDTDALEPVRLPRALDRLDDEAERFEGIVCNPQLLREFDRRSSVEIIASCLEHLEAGGHGLFFAPPNSLSDNLASLVEQAVDSTGIDLQTSSSYGPPDDFPTLENFPEGTAYTGLGVRRE